MPADTPVRCRPIILNGPLKHDDAIDLSKMPRSFQCHPAATTLDEAVSMYAPTPQVSIRHETVTYYLHAYGLLGHRIWVYATESDYQKIPFEDLRDLFDVITNERGKAAVQ
jgi:hypothetical protein